MTATPAVSVVIPAYQVTEYIGEALASVMAQTVTDFEVIVVNDGCPDTENLERALDPYREKIEYIRQANGGPSVARNTGLLRARSPLVALLDADDVWLPGYLEYQLELMGKDPGIDLSYTNSTYFGSGPLVGSLVMDHARSEGEATFESLVEQRCTVLNCATLRREAVIRAGLWHPPMRHSEDFDLWLRMAFRGKVVYTREPLARTRVRAGSLSRSAHTMYGGQLTAYQRALDLPLTPEQRGRVERAITRTRALRSFEGAKEAFFNKDFDTASRLLREAKSVLSFKQKLVGWAIRWVPGPLFHLSMLRDRMLPDYGRIR